MMNRLRRFLPVSVGLVVAALSGASMTSPSIAASARIVAIGASNTSGWGVGTDAAYPAKLQELLKGNGVDAEVVNAGVPFETTSGMLRRLDTATPDGTRIVIIQPGGNDLRFLGSKEQRSANIDAMVSRVTARGMKPIVYDPVFPSGAYQWDRIHLTAEAHATIAGELLPRVIDLLRVEKAATVRPSGRLRR